MSITSDTKKCDALECTDYGSFTISINADAVSDLISRFGTETVNHDLFVVFGHEFGHFVLDNYYIASHLYASVEDAHAKVDGLKYHLTVDAIGMVLTSTERAAFADVLRRTGTSPVGASPDPENDIGSRLKCFANLP